MRTPPVKVVLIVVPSTWAIIQHLSNCSLVSTCFKKNTNTRVGCEVTLISHRMTRPTTTRSVKIGTPSVTIVVVKNA